MSLLTPVQHRSVRGQHVGMWKSRLCVYFLGALLASSLFVATCLEDDLEDDDPELPSSFFEPPPAPKKQKNNNNPVRFKNVPPPRWCGGAPKDFLPFSSPPLKPLALVNMTDPITQPSEYRRRRRHRRKLLVDAAGGAEDWDLGEDASASDRLRSFRNPFRRNLLAATSANLYGCSRTRMRITHEHNGRGATVKPFEAYNLNKNQIELKACLEDIDMCGEGARFVSNKMPGIKAVLKQPPARLGKLRDFKTCAIVGNAGNLLMKKYGAYINKHDAVVRFNTQEMSKFTEFVGSKTTLRVMNHARSRNACCPLRGSSKLPEKKQNTSGQTFLIWHPGGQREILNACKKQFPKASVQALSNSFIKGEVQVMKALRKDVQHMGATGLGSWRQLTSGGHAILMMTRMCQYISLYGFTTYPQSSKVKDQYGGRQKKSRSGNFWHDWTGESYAWRLLHAAGIASICS